jgi:cytochrome b6-f complex iron-sulfur subunit
MRVPRNAVQPTQSNHESPELPVSADAKRVSRREFLYYLWTASAALLGVESVGAGIWFSFPHPQIGVDLFEIDPKSLPQIGSTPIPIVEGGFWLYNAPEGLIVLDMYCTFTRHPHYKFKWVPTNNRFQCPLCGSSYSPSGLKLSGSGPAPRNLDRFNFSIKTITGAIRESRDGSPIDIHDAISIIVDTRFKTLGKRIRPYIWWLDL